MKLCDETLDLWGEPAVCSHVWREDPYFDHGDYATVPVTRCTLCGNIRFDYSAAVTTYARNGLGRCG